MILSVYCIYEAYIVLNPKRMEDLTRGQMLSAEEYQKLCRDHGLSAFTVGIGAEGLRDVLKKINLDDEASKLREDLSEVSSEARRKKILNACGWWKIPPFQSASGMDDLENLPVLPADLRPLVQLDGGRFTNSDINELYRRVINRNNRLTRLMELSAPEVIINNEKRMLQEAVDLYWITVGAQPAVGTNKRPAEIFN